MAEHICPVWVGYLLASPVRKIFQNPEKMLASYIKPGMMVLDVGCAMGFFSLPMARMVGTGGRVVSVDVQEAMLKSLKKRAQKVNLSDRIETRMCRYHSLDLDDLKAKVDFALAFAVVHEVPDASIFYSELHETLKRNGKLLVAEPKGHVSVEAFDETVSMAMQYGFKKIEDLRLWRSHGVVLEKP